ncbi:MAG: RdgB/HAM1 family non-canonical purine NTP pyrophosphatase [Gemmatimonadales bacterium]
MTRWPELLIATRSPGKQKEIRTLLAVTGIQILYPLDLGIDFAPVEDELEVHDTYRANALAKARYFATRSGLPTAADDSGIEVDALGGRPGIHSRRFAPTSENQDRANNQLLIEQLQDVPDERRTARYRCVVAFVQDQEVPPEYFEGLCEGKILRTITGAGGFGYDPVFWSSDLEAGFGQVSQSEKDGVSHRGRAFRKFAEWLKQVE